MNADEITKKRFDGFGGGKSPLTKKENSALLKLTGGSHVVCSTDSPNGWHCCLQAGHDGPHVADTIEREVVAIWD
jgi:hypothetical protein